MPKYLPDQDLPINIKHLEPVIHRVSQRYPHLPPFQIALITKAFFQALRQLLFEGETISISGIFTRFHLLTYSRAQHDSVQVALNTPTRLK